MKCFEIVLKNCWWFHIYIHGLNNKIDDDDTDNEDGNEEDNDDDDDDDDDDVNDCGIDVHENDLIAISSLLVLGRR